MQKYKKTTKRYCEEGYKYEAVFIGDSITANWVREDRGHPDFFKDHNFLGMGYSGKTTDYLKRLFRASVIDKHPRQAVILDGTHPNKDGYTIMESVILPILQAYPAE